MVKALFTNDNKTPQLNDPFSFARTRSQVPVGTLDFLGAVGSDALYNNPFNAISRNVELERSFQEGDIISEEAWRSSPFFRPELEYVPNMTEQTARILAERFDERAARQRIISRRPDGGTLLDVAAFGTTIGASFLDPLNIAVGFIPVVGQARVGLGLGRAAAQAGARGTAARIAQSAGRGAIEGAAGAAVLEPFVADALTAEQADYTAYDFYTALFFGATLGASFGGVGRAGGEFIRKVRSGRQPTLSERVVSNNAREHKSAMQVAIAQTLDGREVDVSSIMNDLTIDDVRTTMRQKASEINGATAREALDKIKFKIENDPNAKVKIDDFRALLDANEQRNFDEFVSNRRESQKAFAETSRLKNLSSQTQDVVKRFDEKIRTFQARDALTKDKDKRARLDAQGQDLFTDYQVAIEEALSANPQDRAGFVDLDANDPRLPNKFNGDNFGVPTGERVLVPRERVEKVTSTVKDRDVIKEFIDDLDTRVNEASVDAVLKASKGRRDTKKTPLQEKLDKLNRNFESERAGKTSNDEAIAEARDFVSDDDFIKNLEGELNDIEKNIAVMKANDQVNDADLASIREIDDELNKLDQNENAITAALFCKL